jgi:hypothetical protein
VAKRLGSQVVLATVVVLAAAALCTPVASASLLGLNNNCGATAQPFAQFGDSRYYTFGTNGGLESGASGWSLAGAQVASGNEPFFSHARTDRYSLSLPSGSSATTPKMCMGTTATFLRFFMKRDTAAGSLRVQVVLRNLLGSVVGVLDWTSASGSTSWQPGPPVLNLDSLLGLLGISSVQLKFTAVGGAYHVDDVWVDPWSSRD